MHPEFLRLVKRGTQIHGEETFTVATSEEIWDALEAAEAASSAELALV